MLEKLDIILMSDFFITFLIDILNISSILQYFTNLRLTCMVIRLDSICFKYLSNNFLSKHHSNQYKYPIL